MTSSILPRLEMLGVRKHFGATLALDGVDLAVEPAQVRALVGENGAGKSTLMKILSGALLPDEGSMFLDGRPYSPSNPLDARRRGVAMIYQELSLCPHLSVEENILLGVEPCSLGLVHKREMRRRAASALAELHHADINPALPVSRLSAGPRQIVEIARAIAVGCRVLILDEPTSSLTQHDVTQLFSLIERLKSRDIAIIYISHFLEEIRRVSDVFTVIRDGRTVGHGLTAESDSNQIISMMVGRQVQDLYPRSPRQPGEIILEIDNLAGRSKPKTASLALRRREVLGIAGLMGAGRTELLRTLFGLEPVHSGSIQLFTRPQFQTAKNSPSNPKLSLAYLGPASPHRRWSRHTGLLSEDRKGEGLALSMTIADNLTLSKLTNLGPGPLIFPGRQRQTGQHWINQLDIRCQGPFQPAGNLSGGNQQKIALGRLLHHDVDILLLDEPTRGIDVASKASIYRLIDQLACAGKAVLIVSSYLPELLGICDRIAVMCRGVLFPARPVSKLNAHQIMLQATGAEESP